MRGSVATGIRCKIYQHHVLQFPRRFASHRTSHMMSGLDLASQQRLRENLMMPYCEEEYVGPRVVPGSIQQQKSPAQPDLVDASPLADLEKVVSSCALLSDSLQT